jgi:hypothetical protein
MKGQILHSPAFKDEPLPLPNFPTGENRFTAIEANSQEQENSIENVCPNCSSNWRRSLGGAFCRDPSSKIQAVANNCPTQALAWARTNPTKAAGATVAVAGATMVAAPMALAAPILGLIGFGSGGVVAGTSRLFCPHVFAKCFFLSQSCSLFLTLTIFRKHFFPGSIAAAAQSAIGGAVAAGSFFATLQSAGAAGYGVAAVASAVQVAGGVVAAGAVGAALVGRGEGGED